MTSTEYAYSPLEKTTQDLKEFKNLKAILEDLEVKFEILCLFSALQTQKLGDYHKEREKLEKDFQSLEVLKRDCLSLITSLKRRWS